jgi:hypothetical protein
MIVLDEQLLGRDLEHQIARWYQGPVCYITDLRPGTVIKDDAIPLLLQRQDYPTFVTINESDFWRKVTINEQFCVVCFALPDSRASEIPTILRDLFRQPRFASKRLRMGAVIRVADQETNTPALAPERSAGASVARSVVCGCEGRSKAIPSIGGDCFAKTARNDALHWGRLLRKNRSQ